MAMLVILILKTFNWDPDMYNIKEFMAICWAGFIAKDMAAAFCLAAKAAFCDKVKVGLPRVPAEMAVVVPDATAVLLTVAKRAFSCCKRDFMPTGASHCVRV